MFFRTIKLNFILIWTFIYIGFSGLPLSTYGQPFGEQQALSAGALWNPSQIHNADLDNDGLPDIIICDEREIQGCINNGDETFSFLECLVPDIKYAHITTADFDNNGTLDIAHVNVHNGYVFGWNKNDGYGHFHHTDTIASDTLIPAFIVSGDIDNDGVVEIILTEGTLANRRFISYHYDGNGQFIPQQNAPIAEHGIAQDLIDIDNDNDLDLIIYSNESYYWLENIGNGIFQQEHTILNEVIYISCFVDMDFDTDMDIIYYSSYRLLWKENMGNGVFGPESLIDSVFYIRDIKCGDMNNDGNIDILLAIIAHLEFNYMLIQEVIPLTTAL